ncbi:MAG: YceI family protein [Corynebacterium sp.]|nr:YceI family protein [Corynebacterium sp.]
MTRNKPLIFAIAIAIVLISLAGVLPLLVRAITGPGVKTGGIDVSTAQPASADLAGEWTIVIGGGNNTSSVGYTFHEILPGEDKMTSGSTNSVTGTATVNGSTLTGGEAVADLSTLRTDLQKRDNKVTRDILESDQFPEARFTVTDQVDLSGLPADGTVGTVTVPGTLTIKGVSHPVTPEFEVLRTGERIILATTIPINRQDYDVKTPEFVAAVIDDQGELNIRLVFEHK